MLHHRPDHGRYPSNSPSRSYQRSSSPAEKPISGSGNSAETFGRGDSADGFELEDLSELRHNAEEEEKNFDSEFEDWASDHERDTEPFTRRRMSASTIQSFMLYTPEEEKSVIKKFDRRLVLFVAFLYMLSFLDRSSTSIATLYKPYLLT